MNLKELKQYCEELCFYTVLEHRALYGILNDTIYSGPTLIYYSFDEQIVYISPELHIEKYPHDYANIHKQYYYYGNSDPREAFYSLKDRYILFNINEDEKIKAALNKLNCMFKEGMIKLRENEIKEDF